MTGLRDLNSSDPQAARASLARCCGSTRWVDYMLRRRPFTSSEELFQAAEDAARGLGRTDWLEAFSHHPKIGDIDSLRSRFASTRTWSAGEQSGVDGASDGILQSLAEQNAAYEKRYGYIFIVCATGKSASEMLEILRSRIGNEPDRELEIAAGEQRKITKIRLEKLLS